MVSTLGSDSRLGRFGRGLTGLILFAVLWEAVARLGLLQGLFFAPFSAVVVQAAHMYASGEIFGDLGYTMGNFALGTLIGLVAGIPLGMLLGWHRRLLDYVDPVISVGLATPVIVLVPLVIASLGIFWQSKVAIGAWSTFFPVLVAMIAGVQGTDAGLVKVARSFRASDMKIIWAVVLPGCLPTLVSGIRLGLTRGLVGVLAAEFFGAPRGLGYLAFNYGSTFQPAKMFVAVLTMAVLGIVLTVIMQALQRHFDAWRADWR